MVLNLGADQRLKPFWRITAASLVTGAAVWLTISLFFWKTGRFSDFYDTVMVFSVAYAGMTEAVPQPTGSIWANLASGMHPKHFLPLLSPVAMVLGLFTAGGLAVGWRRHREAWTALMCYAAAVPIMVALPGRFVPHYYQLWLPPLCLGASWAAAEWSARLPTFFRTQYTNSVSPVGLGMILLVATVELPHYRWPAEEWSLRKYGDVFIRTEAVAKEIDELLLPNETFYQWGSDSGLYFYSRRSPPSGFFIRFPLLAGPLVDSMTARVLRDLNATPPGASGSPGASLLGGQAALAHTTLDHGELQATTGQ